MPEGPELRLAANYVNKVCSKYIFNRIEKSAVTKNPIVEWKGGPFSISAVSRGKEVAMCLKEFKDGKDSVDSLSTFLFFHFGMSGGFILTPIGAIPKHSHLRFFTNDEDENERKVLNFVDVRRFGGWKEKPKLEWASNRGPDPLTEYEEFRQHVLNSLEDKIFQKPLCEVLLNQQYFNGIGNYLRAEIMHRAKAEPFSKAYEHLSTLTKKSDPQASDTDILRLCNSLQLEIMDLEITPYYDPDNDAKDWSRFHDWCQCYMKTGMKKLMDKNKRTVWFSGDAGPMAPRSKVTIKGEKVVKTVKAKKVVKTVKAEKVVKTVKAKKVIKTDIDDEENETSPLKSETVKKQVVKTLRSKKRKGPVDEGIKPPIVEDVKLSIESKPIKKRKILKGKEEEKFVTKLQVESNLAITSRTRSRSKKAE